MNNRIAGGPTDDPLYPHQTWPTIDQCPDCFAMCPHCAEEAVISYLLNFYDADRISHEHILIKEKTDDMRNNLKGKDEL